MLRTYFLLNGSKRHQTITETQSEQRYNIKIEMSHQMTKVKKQTRFLQPCVSSKPTFSVWFSSKSSWCLTGKEQRVCAGSIATPMRSCSPLSLSSAEHSDKRSACCISPESNSREKGESKVLLWGPHTSTMTSPSPFFALHSNSLRRCDNGWHRYSSRDFVEKSNWKF